jgi:hypothetical protein
MSSLDTTTAGGCRTRGLAALAAVPTSPVSFHFHMSSLSMRLVVVAVVVLTGTSGAVDV